MALSSTPDSSVILPLLREATHPGLHTVVHRRLLPQRPEVPGPWVTFVQHAGAYRTPLCWMDDDRWFGEIEREALANLCQRERRVDEVAPSVLTVVGTYAAEAILLCPFVSEDMAARLKCDTLVVSAPDDGPVLVTSMFQVETVAEHCAWAQARYDAPTGRRISRYPLLVRNGAVVGVVGFGTEPVDVEERADTRKRPWWRRW